MKENSGWVSIIVPVYNVQEYIEECIRSIISQSYSQIEVILVDDVGADDSMAIAGKMLATSKLSWQTISHKHNRGLSAARNSGVEVARGEFIYFLDSDDWISPTCIEVLVESARKHQSQIVSASFCDYELDGTFNEIIRECSSCSETPLEFYVDKNSLAFSMACNRLIRRDFYAASGVRFSEGIYYEDEPWTFAIMSKATRVSFVKDATYFYRRRVGSITVNQKLNMVRINSRYYHLRNCTELFLTTDIINKKGVREWFARVICNFLSALVKSDLKRDDKTFFLNKLFSEIYIPTKELNRMTFCMYGLLKKISFLFPASTWVNALMFIRNFKSTVLRKIKK